MSKNKIRKEYTQPTWSWTVTTSSFLIVATIVAWFIKEPGFEPLAAAIPSLIAILVYFGLKNTANQRRFDQIIATFLLIVTIPLILFLSLWEGNDTESPRTTITPTFTVFSTVTPSKSEVVNELITPTNSEVPQILNCNIRLTGGFGIVWNENSNLLQGLGCPFLVSGSNTSIPIALQHFDGGMMIALPNKDNQTKVYVLSSDNSFTTFDYLDILPPPEDGIYTIQYHYFPGPTMIGPYYYGFDSDTRNDLGFATTRETRRTGEIQSFENGIMIWYKELDQIYVLMRKLSSESIHGRSARSMSTETLPCHAERSLRSEASRTSDSSGFFLEDSSE